MNNGLPPIPSRFLDGDEPLRGSGAVTSLAVRDYWRWSDSCLMDNTARGILAEFLVSTALKGYIPDRPRTEWEAYDFVARIGKRKVTIEVKSSAKVQSWKQTKYSSLKFGIAPSKKWKPEIGKYSEEALRADIYVFCALIETNLDHHAATLDTDNWRFCVVPGEALGKQKTIVWNRVKRIASKVCGFDDLGREIEDVAGRRWATRQAESNSGHPGD